MKIAIKGQFFHFLDTTNQKVKCDSDLKWTYIQKGCLLVENGKVVELGAEKSFSNLEDYEVHDYGEALILPGFIDLHTHYVQTEMVGCYGEQLIDWLNKYTYPTELKFSSLEVAQKIADNFLNQLIKSGTTTALVFSTSFDNSVEGLFEKSVEYNFRTISGKVLMDRNAPRGLIERNDESIKSTRELIKKWHGKGKIKYAITPRFALTSSPEQLKEAGKLSTEFQDVYIQTHISENINEIDKVMKAFPDAKDYLEIYEINKLLRKKSIFAHGIHLSDSEFERISLNGAGIAVCPCSNLFLGSGLFNFSKAFNNGINMGWGTDVGAGPSFSVLSNMAEGYKVAQLNHTNLSPEMAYYMATLGAARSLELDREIGNFEKGKMSDIVVVDLKQNKNLFERSKLIKVEDIKIDFLNNKLFPAMILGNSQIVKATYLSGKRAFLYQSR